MTSANRQIFVLQPFDEMSEGVHELIRAAAARANAEVLRADSIGSRDDGIISSIVSAIGDSALVIADITSLNANVMYEVGLAQAFNKPVIFIADSSLSIPFYIGNARSVIYNAAKPNEFVVRLSRSINEAFENQEEFLFERAIAKHEHDRRVFISYSHSDKEYLDRLLVHLKPLEKKGLLDLWVDTRLRAGDKWKAEIEKALDRATAAVLLVSADFLASDFITDNELPPLLKNAEERGTRIIPLIVKPCRFTRDEHLSQFQAVNDPEQALILLPPGKQEHFYDRVAMEVER